VTGTSLPSTVRRPRERSISSGPTWHQDRDRACDPQPLADGEAVDARQHQIENHEIGRRALDDLERVLARGRLGDVVALAPQNVSEQLLDLGVVVNDQNSGQRCALPDFALVSSIVPHSERSSAKPERRP
jgi:hypothetical protein